MRTKGDGETVRAISSDWSGTVKATTSSCMEITVTVSDSEITEGGKTVFTITSSPAPTSAMIVELDVEKTGDFVKGHTFARDTQATSGPAGPPSVYFRPNKSSVGFEVLTTDDSVDETDGSVTYTIAGADGFNGYVKGSPSTATVTIRDNDPSPTVPPTTQPTATPPPSTPTIPPAPTGVTAVAENASSFTVIGTALATYPNQGDEVLHTIESGNDKGKFRIDGFAGFILVRGALDFETKSSYTLTIKADDGNGGTDTATVTITVEDVAE